MNKSQPSPAELSAATNKKRTLSEKHKENIRKNSGHRIGSRHSEETKEKIRNKLLGKKFTEKHKLAIKKGRTGKKHSNETKDKIGRANSVSLKGRKLSEETREKLSILRKGRKLSEKIKLKISGDNNHNWKGGKSFEPYSPSWTTTLKISIRERDRYNCQLCGERQGDKAHDVHHINYNKNDCNPENLVTLCKRCHTKTNYDREYWEKHFKYKRAN